MIAIAAFAVLVVIATAAAWSLSTRDLAATAIELDQVDLALGSAAVTRATTAQAVVFAVDNANGTADDEALRAAVGEAAANLDAFEQLSASVAGHRSPPDAATLAGLSAEGWAIIDDLGAGEIDQARARIEGVFEERYQAAIGSLGIVRADLAATVESAANLAASTSTAVRLAVTLAMPALLVIALWRLHSRAIGRLQEQSAQRAVADAAKVDRLEKLLHAVSHRFRTPLTSIYGLSDVMVQNPRVKGLDRELVSLINSESANLHRIAEDVLAATQLETGTLQVTTEIISLAEIIEDAVKPARASGVAVDVDCGDIWVMSDGAKVRQILRNLVANAVQHGAEPILVEVAEAGGVVSCAVTDHGSGFAPEELDNGTGLRVADALATLIGAALEIERSDTATRFTLLLSEGEIPPGEAASADSAEPAMVEAIPQPLAAQQAATGDPE